MSRAVDARNEALRLRDEALRRRVEAKRRSAEVLSFFSQGTIVRLAAPEIEETGVTSQPGKMPAAAPRASETAPAPISPDFNPSDQLTGQNGAASHLSDVIQPADHAVQSPVRHPVSSENSVDNIALVPPQPQVARQHAVPPFPASSSGSGRLQLEIQEGMGGVGSGHEWPYAQDASQGYSASPTLTPHAPAQHADDEQTTADEDDGGYSSNRESHSSADGKVHKIKRKGFSRSLRSMSRRGHGQVRALARVHKLNEMGEIVDKKGHRAWDMACALQLGIRVHVSMNNHVRGEPGFDTFRETVKLKFPPAGGALTPPHKGSSFKFKDYAPSIFSRLREVFSIDTADYMVALCNTAQDGSNALRIMGTPGKSGSLFFFSENMQFIVKTLPKREAKMLIEILPAYYQHVMQNPGTYLPRFYGLHRWKPEYGRNVRFVVMNNVFATNLAIHRRFDLKGSTMGRSASQADRAKGHRCILKDNDLVASGFKLKMGPARKRAFLDQVRCDCFFLMSLKIMDYSMLVGVHYRDEPLGATAEPTAASSNVVGTASTPQTSNKPPNTRLSAILLEPNPDAPPHVHPSQPASSAAHVDVADVSEAVGEATVGEEHPSMPALGANSSQLELTSRPINVPSNSGDHLSAIVAQELDGDPGHYNPSGIEGRLADGEAAGERYFLGVIDILMLYTRRKKLERVWKTFTDGEGASSQPPPDYASRFCKFLDSITE